MDKLGYLKVSMSTLSGVLAAVGLYLITEKGQFIEGVILVLLSLVTEYGREYSKKIGLTPYETATTKKGRPEAKLNLKAPEVPDSTVL